MEKVRTQIPGLDLLLHGGMQLYTNTENCQETVKNNRSEKQPEPDSLVIVIKGAKGVYKTTLAMQLMQGLTVSMKCYNQRPGNGKALFYSINKDKNDLNDSYLDMIIGQFLKRVVSDYRKERFASNTDCDDIKDRNVIDGILDFLFDFENRSRDNMTQFKASQRFGYVLPNIARMVCEGIVNYSQRTNSLHFVRNYLGDDNMNLVATRSHDSIEKYWAKLHDGKNELVRTSKAQIAEYFVNSLINLKFNGFEKDEYDTNRINPTSPIDKYQAIENDLYNKWYQECRKKDLRKAENSEKRQDEKSESNLHDVCRCHIDSQPYDCIVIDGFSQLQDSELNDLPYGYLTENLRRLAKITILVFDEREGARCDGDIVIEMKEDYDNDESYMYHQLRIAKSIFQTVVLGWHQYKKRDFGIEIFPSQHMQLSKRYYIQNKTKHIGQSLFDSSIEEYLDAKNYRDCISGTVDDCPSKLTFERFIERQHRMSDCLHDYIYTQYAHAINNVSSPDTGILQKNKEAKDKYRECVKDIFEDVLCFNFPPKKSVESNVLTNTGCGQNKDCDRNDLIETDHFPCTVIIGNPNSYKRTFALATAHKLACLEHPIHTLFFLFDKNELDMRTKMVCPAFYGKIDKRLPECRKCDKFIHTYNMRMGCISPNEFFTILQEQISFYCKTSSKTGNEHTWMHIVLDDIQKIQFSFPFLHNTKLFLSALMEICRQNKVRLTVLCDKNSELTREISSIADNVITIRRNEEDIYNVDFYIERRLHNIIPSRIIKLNVRDILHLFRCNKRNMHIAFSTKNDPKDKKKSKYQEFIRPILNGENSNGILYRVTPQIIGSMKEYWRKTGNAIIQHRGTGNDADNSNGYECEF